MLILSIKHGHNGIHFCLSFNGSLTDQLAQFFVRRHKHWGDDCAYQTDVAKPLPKSSIDVG